MTISDRFVNVSEVSITRNIKIQHKDDRNSAAKNGFYNKSIWAAIFYGVCSTSMAFINKTVVTSYDFNFTFFIMACQMICSIISLEILRIANIIQLPKYTLKEGSAFKWPSLFYAIHSITALHALSGMSIPMYAAIKRCAPIVTLILSVFVLRKPCPKLTLIASVVLITFGCLIAGIGDLQFDAAAYAHGTVSVVVQGLYLILVQKGAESNLSALQILYLNSYNTLPFFCVLSILLNEIHGVLFYPRLTDGGFTVCFLLQVLMGVFLSYSLFLCTAQNSALTTTLVGVMKSILQTVIGSFTFGGIKPNLLNVFGIGLNTYGGIMYVHTKYREKKQLTKSISSLNTV